ncbi:vanadium-dependent haloperoxidase [Actinoplanes oblitus]|uniref:Vanadium-dependent haloperoxidase n=1 Tax=Actinoplanes oblitus TaxID=3040509 RepID=A0ABY8WI83_9ACTN|nr:vanadium-dependent haloperoxidase [Actinoplanes oblitus]WIM96798.1 vanadium-dependent haloperoxidase [Actinoplanes oblitus]
MRSIKMRSLVASAAAALSISGVAAVVSPTPAYAIAVPPCDSHVDYWTDVLLTIFRKQTGEAGAPTRLTRAAAMMYLAMYDTDISLGTPGTPYIAKVAKTDNATYIPTSNFDAAATTALHNAFPSFDLSGYQSTAAKSCFNGEPGPDGFSSQLGLTAAQNVINARANDGSNNTTAYSPQSNVAGQWRPTEGKAAVSPNWGSVKPFGIGTSTQFRPPLPGGFSSMSALLTSKAYADQVNEVKAAGSATATPDQRTADQTTAAYFWANDVDGTYKPPGQLLKITQEYSKANPGSNRIKLFALLSMAMADSAIAAWDAKFDTIIDLWRPDSAIEESQSDNNALTTPSPAWTPLSADAAGNHFSPPFPAYISGHATFAGAWAGVMKRYYGTDAATFTATTEDIHASGVTRTFTSFSAAAQEDALSRLWLGVHYRWDADYGLSTGDSVANYVFGNRLR